MFSIPEPTTGVTAARLVTAARQVAGAIVIATLALMLLLSSIQASGHSQPANGDFAHADVRIIFDPIQFITTSPTAHELAQAMGIDAGELITAEVLCDSQGWQPAGCAGLAVVGTAQGTWFPTEGATFAFMSTGFVVNSLLDDLGGLKNETGGDVVRLHMGLLPPADSNCLSLDFTFYTIDLPQTAPATFAPGDLSRNDTFTAQIDQEEIFIVTGTNALPRVGAPGNFALNEHGEPVSISTMAPLRTMLAISMAIGEVTGVTIDGVFPLLQARTRVTPGVEADIYLTIQDVAGSLDNSAVALDNLSWIDDPQCETGWTGDQDGDGLPDGWEIHGRHHRHPDGTVEFVDLPAMGADPTTKDIFVEIDFMGNSAFHDPQPIVAAMERIQNAFAAAPVDGGKGIRLHIDYGTHAPIVPSTAVAARTPVTWGLHGLDRGGVLSPTTDHIAHHDPCPAEPSIWPAFDEIRSRELITSRQGIFHYALFAHMLSNCAWQGVSGASANLPYEYLNHGASSFIVSLGYSSWQSSSVPMADVQAGTFMHELGHNLGLTHDGGTCIGKVDGNTCRERYGKKPNHLSVMNYLYQTTGGLLAAEDAYRFDYQRFDSAPLNEWQLWEGEGLAVTHLLSYTMGARYYCPGGVPSYVEDAAVMDWNCNGITDTTPISVNINGNTLEGSGLSVVHFLEEELRAFSEWDKLVFTGGYLNRQRNMLDMRPFVMFLRAAYNLTASRPELSPLLRRPVPIAEDQILAEISAEEHAEIPSFPRK